MVNSDCINDQFTKQQRARARQTLGFWHMCAKLEGNVAVVSTGDWRLVQFGRPAGLLLNSGKRNPAQHSDARDMS
jgi:hypothetical protein